MNYDKCRYLCSKLRKRISLNDSMKAKTLLTFITAMVLSLPAKAQLFWRISGNDMPEPSFLLGSFHLEKDSFCDSIPGFKEAFQAVKQAYFEYSIFDTPARGSNQIMMMPEGRTFESLFTEDELSDVLDLVAKITGIRYGKVQFSPQGLSQFLNQELLRKSFPDLFQFSEEAMDLGLQKRAKSLGKQVYGLETLEFQLGLIYGQSRSLEEQAKNLLEWARSPESDPEVFKAKLMALHQAYRSQDFQTIEKEIAALSSTPTAREFIFNRNETWMPVLRDAVRTNPTLIVVGAGHLVGEDGLVSLLREEGFTLSPMK